MRNAIRTTAFLVFTLLSFQSFAQREETVLGEHNLRFSGIWADWNHQITQFGNSNSYVSGWQFNLEFGKALLLGYGNYYLQDDVEWDQINNQTFDLRFSAFKIGYAIQAWKAIHPIVGVDFGPGRIRLNNDQYKDRIFLVQPGAGIELNVFRWGHILLQGGYRFATDTNLPGLDDEDLSGFYGQATMRFGFSWGKANQKPKYRD